MHQEPQDNGERHDYYHRQAGIDGGIEQRRLEIATDRTGAEDGEEIVEPNETRSLKAGLGRPILKSQPDGQDHRHENEYSNEPRGGSQHGNGRFAL